MQNLIRAGELGIPGPPETSAGFEHEFLNIYYIFLRISRYDTEGIYGRVRRCSSRRLSNIKA